MADQRDQHKPKSDANADAGELSIGTPQVEISTFGHQSGPPLVRTSNAIPKQWQPPQNESTPSNRTNKG